MVTVRYPAVYHLLIRLNSTARSRAVGVSEIEVSFDGRSSRPARSRVGVAVLAVPLNLTREPARHRASVYTVPVKPCE